MGKGKVWEGLADLPAELPVFDTGTGIRIPPGTDSAPGPAGRFEPKRFFGK